MIILLRRKMKTKNKSRFSRWRTLRRCGACTPVARLRLANSKVAQHTVLVYADTQQLQANCVAGHFAVLILRREEMLLEKMRNELFNRVVG